MGFESFNAEPVVPDESERVDDVAKAEEMAYAGKFNREMESGYKKIASGETPFVYDKERGYSTAKIVEGVVTGSPEHDVKDTAAGKAEYHDLLASVDEELAGEQFEKQKEGNQ